MGSYYHFCMFITGTSVIRSQRPLEPNTIHYWEIKIVHWLSGTDLVCTDMSVSKWKHFWDRHFSKCFLLCKLFKCYVWRQNLTTHTLFWRKSQVFVSNSKDLLSVDLLLLRYNNLYWMSDFTKTNWGISVEIQCWIFHSASGKQNVLATLLTIYSYLLIFMEILSTFRHK